MFYTVYQITQAINHKIKFLTEGIESGKATEEYISATHKSLKWLIEELKRISSDEKLIKRYSNKVNKIINK